MNNNLGIHPFVVNYNTIRITLINYSWILSLEIHNFGKISATVFYNYAYKNLV